MTSVILDIHITQLLKVLVM